MEKIIMENANSHPFKVSIVKDATMFANSHPYKVSIEGGGGNEGRVVDELPEEGEPGYIYLVLKESSPEGDIYDEYMWVLQQDGETYGWEHIGATNEVNLDVVKILTQDDYNWNSRTASATEPYDTIALWLLDDGLYKAPGITVRPVANTVVGGNNTNLYLVSKAESNIRRGSVVCFSGVTSVLYSAVDANGQNYATNKFFRGVSQTTGSSTEDLMSQKAITDAINEVAGVERELSISDYDYFPDPNLGGVDLRDAPIGRYYTNEPNDALVRCYLTSVEFVYLRKDENYLEVCETTNGIKTYKMREYDTDGSVKYYDVDVANDTYEFQEYYAKGTVQDNLNSDSTVYALSARQGKVLKNMIDASGIKVLTTADYNYPVANPTRIVLWRLPEGIYTLQTSISVYASDVFVSDYQMNRGDIVIVTSDPVSSYKIVYITHCNGDKGLIYKTTDGNTAQVWFPPSGVTDNLNSTNTNSALSANQGKVLNDKIGQIETVLQTLTTGNGV